MGHEYKDLHSVLRRTADHRLPFGCQMSDVEWLFKLCIRHKNLNKVLEKTYDVGWSFDTFEKALFYLQEEALICINVKDRIEFLPEAANNKKK